VFKNDFIELYNRGASPASLAGWSVQYASSSGTSWQITPLSGTIPAHGYYLVQEAAGSGGTQSLPAPDATGAIAMAAGSGKVALVAGASALSGSCPLASAVDFVGYGAANCSEGGAAAPLLTNTTAGIRAGGGAIDTNNNAADFSAGTPDPHNSAGIPPVATGFATPATVTAGGTTKLTVTVTPGDLPPSTGIAVTANLGAIGGSASQPFYDDGSHGDVAAGDNTFSFDTVVTGTAGIFGLPASATDAQSRTANTTIRLAIETAFTPIYTLQGIGSTSPFAGQLVTTAGVVTALKFNGFYIQVPEIESDGDAATSDGIFVFTSSAPPSFLGLGDAVRVVGTMQEYVPAVAPTQPPLTEIVGAVFGVVSRGNAIPAPVILQPSFTTPDGGPEQLERFEAMRVAADIVATTGTDGGVNETEATGSSNGEFYAVIKGVARPVREPGYDPSETLPADAPCCVPAFDGNPEKLRVDSDAQIGAAKIEIVAGQSLDGLTGVLDYGFFAYTILPDPGAHVPTGPAAAAPVTTPGADQFTVSSFNLERFYNNVDDPGISEPVLSVDGFERRLSKASLAIRNILRTPDVLGTIEIENLATLQTLAARVNADAVAAGQPDPNYVAYLEEGNDPGGIDVGFLVKSSRVTVVSVTQIGKDTSYVRVDNGQTDLLNDRPPLVLRADVLSDGEPYPITVIVNHLRSLNGMTDPGGAGARVRQKRRLQAEFLATYIQELQSTNPNERVISVGDYNAFQFNDGWVDLIGTIEGQPTPADQVVEPSADLVNPNLFNTGDLLSDAAQYSYTFDGNAQAIDHILVNQAAYKRFSAIEYAHLDADFPESLRSDATRPERISDHDAAVAYFQFPGAPVITLVGGSEITVEAYGAAFVDPGYSAYDDDLGVVPVQVSGSVDVNTLGDYTLTYTATNGYKSATVTRLVHVVDTTAPSIIDFVVAPNMLWPANHTMIPVAVAYTATDGSGIATCSLAVESNEAQNGLGDGDTDVDWLVDSPTAVQLRAERSALGAGRVYGVIVSCVDPSGNRAMQRGAVMVPLNYGGR
jgi:predicted extracellular nuclease